MGGSIASGIGQLPDSARGALIIPCDLPRLLGSELLRLVEAWRDEPESIVAARYGDVVGSPAIFPRQRFRQLTLLSGDQGAGRFLRDGPVRTVELPSAAEDLDHPEDLEDLTRS